MNLGGDLHAALLAPRRTTRHSLSNLDIFLPFFSLHSGLVYTQSFIILYRQTLFLVSIVIRGKPSVLTPPYVSTCCSTLLHLPLPL